MIKQSHHLFMYNIKTIMKIKRYLGRYKRVALIY